MIEGLLEKTLTATGYFKGGICHLYHRVVKVAYIADCWIVDKWNSRHCGGGGINFNYEFLVCSELGEPTVGRRNIHNIHIACTAG